MKTTRPLIPLFVCLSLVFLFRAQGAAEVAPIGSGYFRVLRGGDVRELREALDHGSSANARDAWGNTPLMLAAEYANVACLRLLIDRGAEVNVANKAGATPLMRAACDYEKVRLLVDRGAEVKSRSALGNTALMLAARPANSHRAVELLLSRGADPKATNNWGATALMAAAAGGDEASVRLLLKQGADVNAQPGADPVSFILGGGRSALMWAAFRGDVAMTRVLINAGANVNSEGALGSPLSQAAWADHTAVARLLMERGAKVDLMTHMDGYTPLHWAAASEQKDVGFVKLLLDRGANPNCEGGEPVDAFMAVPQTPLMLARRRGDTAILSTLLAAGATNETPDRVRSEKAPARQLPEPLDAATVRAAVARALPLLQASSLSSKQAFASHFSKQDCTSCHQQFLPLAALGLARKHQAPVNAESEQELIKLVREGELKMIEADLQPLFHPEPVHTKGYLMFGFVTQDLPATEFTDSWVHHLATIQGRDGRWFNNLPRPPLQTGDVGATALAVQALQRYPLPGRKDEFADRVDRARQWLWSVKAQNTEERAYQILGLSWAGESPRRLQSLAKSLLSEQSADGGWSQLSTLKSDAYATGQAVYALRVGAGLAATHPAIERGRRSLLETQLADGTWYVHRRAFPFQPTMQSGFPHGRDGWISAAATSWAIMALSLPEQTEMASRK